METNHSFLYQWEEEARRRTAEARARLEEVWEFHLDSEKKFLIWAKAHYSFRQVGRYGSRAEGTVSWLYKYGRDLRVLTATFEQFRWYIHGEAQYIGPRCYRQYFAYPHPKATYFRRGEFWYTMHGTDFRQRLGYHGGSSKKELSEREAARRNWREHKQLKRDKSKCYGRRCGYDRIDNEQHNRYVRHYNKQQCRKGFDNEVEWDKIPNKKKGYWRRWW